MSSDELVRWTIAAYMSNPEAGHDELVDLLSAAGVPGAHHACAIVPVAFGRQILEGLVTLPPAYLLGDREVAYADDPVFVAAREHARYAPRAQIERIGLVSAEVTAVNQALHAGSKPEDLVLGTSVLSAGASGDGVLATPAPLLDELVRAHGATMPLEARVFPSTVKPGRVQLQIDIVARRGDRSIMESFAGLGETVGAAIANAVEKFSRGSLHVLLATLAGREHGADQVEWERFRDFQLCSGPLLRQWSAEPLVDYAAVLDAIKDRLPALSRELHWFRVFVAIDRGKLLGLDALLDNEPCGPVVDLLETWPWPVGERAYALRHFFMLVPADPPA